MANEGQYYHETRSPFKQTADYATVTLSTTSLMVLPAAAMPGSPLTTPAGYWDLGKEWEIQMFGKMTTVLTPGNLTIEIRYGTADNAGTILATSAATALAASKTGISWRFRCKVVSRGQIGTACPLFAHGWFTFDGAGGLFTTAANNPLLLPAANAVQVNVDTTVASGINVQMKRSGSTAETVTLQALDVNSRT